MNKELEKILVSAVFEEVENRNELSVESMTSCIEILLEDSEVFDEIPKNIFISPDDYRKVEENTKKFIDFFPKKGCLLYDGIYGAAFGRLKYIYKSKGSRIYLFEDKSIKVFANYCSIDSNGFSLSNEEIDSFQIKDISSAETIDSIFAYITDEYTKNASTEIIKILCEVKKPFIKDYVIEYLILPPDVNTLSALSTQIKSKLWDICLSQKFVESWSLDIQYNAISLLASLGLSPNAEQLLKFLDVKQSNNSNADVLERIDLLQSTLISVMEKSSKQDIIDFKPNFMGMGININEVIQRIKKM